MNFAKKTIFWLIILVVIGGGLYLLDRRAEDVKVEREKALRLFPFLPQEVTAFVIKRDGQTIKMEKRDEVWWVVEPVIDRGDKEIIESFLDNVVNARKDAILFEEAPPEKLEELGLARPYITVVFTTPGGTTQIIFGRKGPTHNISYAMLEGDPRVYRIHSDVGKEADKGLYDMRDKTIIAFEPLETKKVELYRKGRKNVIIEQPLGGKWDMMEPIRARADIEKVLETLYRLKESDIKYFIDNPSEDEDYGFGEPILKLYIEDEDGRQGLIVGRKNRKIRGYFAKRDGAERVFIVEEDMVHHLLQPAEHWSAEDERI